MKEIRKKWKALTPAEEQRIIKAKERGMVCKEIMRKYGIPAGQFYNLVRRAIIDQQNTSA